MIITEKVRTQLAGDFPKVCLCRKGLRSEWLNVSDSVPHLLCFFFYLGAKGNKEAVA